MRKLLRALWPFLPRLGKTYHVIGVTKDRRNKAQLESNRAIVQERLDAELERIWRANIRRNEIARLERKLLARAEAELRMAS